MERYGTIPKVGSGSESVRGIRARASDGYPTILESVVGEEVLLALAISKWTSNRKRKR